MSRAKGHTAIGGAAYRAGENIKARGVGPNGEDKWYRYSPKGIVVRETFIMTPDGAPDYATDRAELWNRVEEIETRSNARLGRDVELGLAYELNFEEQRALVREFAQSEFVDKGFVVDVAIHNYGRTLPAIGPNEDQAQRIRDWAEAGVPFLSKDDAFGRSDMHVMEMTNRDGAVTGYKLYQPHAHVRVTPRACADGDFIDNKAASRELNRSEKAMQWRYDWPKLQNAYLERAGSDLRVSSTSADEDQFPDVRFRATSEKSQTRTIEQRADELSEEQRAVHAEKLEAKEADELFREMHNESLKDAYVELEASSEDQAEDKEETRRALWWHNMSTRFNQWRFDFREKADEWRDRFEQQKTRIRQVIGWHGPPSQKPDDILAQTEPIDQGIPPPDQEPKL